MAKRLELNEESGELTVQLTLWGRVVAGTFRGIKIFPWLALIAGVFFLPDYIGRYRAEEPVTGLFWLSILSLVFLGCFLWGVLRVLRRDRWVFDGNSRRVIAEVPRLFRQPARGEADLREIEALQLKTRRFPFESELTVRIDTADEGVRTETILAEPGMGAQIEQAADAIIEFLRDHRYYVDLERADEHDETDGGSEDDQQ